MNPVSTLCLHKHQDKHQDKGSFSGQQWFSASPVPKCFQFAIHNFWTTQYQTGSSVDFALKSPLNCHAYSNQKYLVAGKQSLHIGSLFTKYPQDSLNQKQSGVSDSKSTSFAPKAILSAMLSLDRISRVPRNWVTWMQRDSALGIVIHLSISVANFGRNSASWCFWFQGQAGPSWPGISELVESSGHLRSKTRKAKAQSPREVENTCKNKKIYI